MKLIADSGSTKTEWILLDKDIQIFNTIGLNPVFVDENIVYNTIEKSELINFSESITEIQFFGAGCSSAERNKIIFDGLSKQFKNAKITINSDLLGAGIAMFGKETGIIGILGTGSNTGLYQHKNIKKNISSLGYILGDEGSGANIGKIFIKAFLNNELPKDISKNFKDKYKLELSDIIQKVYKEPFPNRFLASLSKFVYENKSKPYIKELLDNCFCSFLEKTILKYENHQDYKIKLIGSIAYFFSDEIRISAQKLNIEISDIAKSPSQGLIKFFAEK